MVKKAIKIFLLVMLVITCTGCSQTDDDMAKTDETETSGNVLFEEASEQVSAINYWINDQSYEVSDSEIISEFFLKLSSVAVKEEEDPQKDGGFFVDLISNDGTYTLTLYEEGFLYDGTYYNIEQSNTDWVSGIKDILSGDE